MNLEMYNFKGQKNGHHLLVFGAIHGNEKCGSQGCFKMIKDIQEGTVEISCGQVTFIPVCNPKSYANNVRFTDSDLNRIIMHHDQPKLYEEHIANALIPYIDACDTLLDIHSMGADSEPCIFTDYPTKDTIALIKNIDVPHILTDWETVYEDVENCKSTEYYAHNKGKSCITLECGQHTSPQAPAVAYKAIYNSLAHLGIIESQPKRLKHKQEHYKFTHMFRKKEGAAFAQNWHHMQTIKKDELIGKDNQQTYICPNNAIIVMPAPYAKINNEWFYLAEKFDGFLKKTVLKQKNINSFKKSLAPKR